MNYIQKTNVSIFFKIKLKKFILILCVLQNTISISAQKDGAIDNSFNYEIASSGSLTECRKIEQTTDESLLMSGKGFYNVIGWESGAAIEKRTINGEFLNSVVNGSTKVTFSCDAVNTNDGFFIAQKNDSNNVLIYNELISGVQKRCYLSGFLNMELFDYKKLNDGSILACGWCSLTSGTNQILILKFTSDFKLDKTFGGGSFPQGFNYFYSGFDAQARALAVQSDGKIVLVGHEISPKKQSVILRYNANGTLDKSFFTNGYTYSDVKGELYGVKLDAADNIYAVGNFNNVGVDYGSDIYIIRNGIKYHKYFYFLTYFTIDIDKNGYVYAGGYAKAGNITLQSPCLRRYKPSPDGVVDDTTFNAFGHQFGVYLAGTNNENSSIYTLKVLNDGKLMIGGIYNGEIFVKKIKTGKNNTNITAQKFDSKFELFPNPVIDNITIKAPQIKSIEIVDIIGKTLLSIQGNQSNSQIINITNLNPAVYYIKINNLIIQRIIKI